MSETSNAPVAGTDSVIYLDKASLAAAELKADGEGQRIANVMLANIAATLAGITLADAIKWREEYCQKFGRAKAETAKVKSSAREDKFGGNVVWPTGTVPPVIRQFNEIADLVYKLRKAGGMAGDVRLPVVVADVVKKHTERFGDIISA